MTPDALRKLFVPYPVPRGDEYKPLKSVDEFGVLDFSAVENVHSDFRFQAMGCAPVPLRSSVVRIVVFKLLGTGVLSALMAASAQEKKTAFSCALAAAVNTVAIVHYWISY